MDIIQSGKAAIDCGTNSFRLLIVDDGMQIVEQKLIITRLGEGLAATGQINNDAIKRATDALAEFAADIGRHHVSNVRAVATAAARSASNSHEFLDAAKATLGFDIETITGEQEGALTFAGVAAGVDVTGPTLVVDIGGGSTELIFGMDGKLEWAVSLEIGCVRLTERFLHSDPYINSELKQASEYASDLIASAAFSTIPPATRLIGVAGSVTSLAAIIKHIKTYTQDCVHGLAITRDEVEQTGVRLATLSNKDRLALPALPTGRADVITAGAIILAEVMRQGDFDTCLISERDLLFGLVL